MQFYKLRTPFIAVPESAYETLKFKVSGKIINIHDRLPVIGEDNVCFIEAFIPFVGGKGGFGSMLRAIGAQIEKTTNREACRDLSGRRIRDINEEKRLKDWIAKKADREKEKQERKKAKLEKLCQETKHEFHDPTYDKQRSEISDKVYESVEKVFITFLCFVLVGKHTLESDTFGVLPIDFVSVISFGK
nr:EOG090X0OE5 [Artemia franciscana]